MAKTKDDFEKMRLVTAREGLTQAGEALRLSWWFIENVAFDDPDRDEVFFDLREIVRGVGQG